MGPWGYVTSYINFLCYSQGPALQTVRERLCGAAYTEFTKGLELVILEDHSRKGLELVILESQPLPEQAAGNL